MNKDDLIEKIKLNIALENFKDDLKKENILEEKKYRRNFYMKKKIIAIVCGCVIMVSGVALATNFENIAKYFRGLGEGIDSAVESGYIKNTEMNFINSETSVETQEKTVKDVNVEIKVEDFLMDNTTLSSQFVLKFEDKINEFINFEKVEDVELKDLIIIDDKNRIIYSGNVKDTFDDVCQEYRLNYTFAEHNENYLNCGLNKFLVNKDLENNTLNLMYNMYTDEFPKSKKLTYYFTQIILSEENSKEKIKVKGKWNFDIEVPEEMYNRTEEYYKVISCDNENFEVYTSKVTETGFELGVKIKNIEMPNERLSVEELQRIVTLEQLGNENLSQEEIEELGRLRQKYYEYDNRNTPISINKLKNEKVSYVENSNGDVFECTLGSSRMSKKEWIDSNNYDFYETFGMTKANSTDRIKVVLYYYGSPVTIELEK